MQTPEERFTGTQYFDIQEGWDVYSSDGKKIGDVHEIHRGMGAEPGYFVVEKGLLFTKDLYIPFTAVSRVEQDCVYVNCVSDQCDRMGWEKPPTYATTGTTGGYTGEHVGE